MSERTFKTYFLIVKTGNSAVAFHEMLLRINEKPLAERTIAVSESPMRLSELDRSQGRRGMLLGDLERVQMGNFPLRADLLEESQELEFDEDQGLGHRSAFLYDARSGVLAIQGNVTGVGTTRFRRYIINLLGSEIQPLEVEFEVIMLPEDDANRAYQADAEFRKLTFAVTDPNTVANTLAHLKGERPIASTMLRSVGQEGSSIRMTVTLSAGRSRKARLIPSPIREFIRALKGARDEGASVEKLSTSGSFGGENAELNFLPDKLAHSERVEVERRSMPIEERKRALLRAHSEKLEILRGMFPRDETLVI